MPHACLGHATRTSTPNLSRPLKHMNANLAISPTTHMAHTAHTVPSPLAEPSYDEVLAACTLEEIEQVIAYDLYLVRVLGRPGVMRTYEWMMGGPSDDKPCCLKVVFR